MNFSLVPPAGAVYFIKIYLNLLSRGRHLMSSAIELYKEAYDLDFNKGESLYAETLYKELIERFPHSDEKEYAQVHLERIAKLKGNPDDPAFKPLRTGGSSNSLVFVCFALILLILTALGFGASYGLRLQKQLRSNELVIHGLLSERNGNRQAAEDRYEEARRIFPKNGAAYHCLADLYLRSGKPEASELVSRQWELLQPYDIALMDFRRRLADTAAHRDTLP